MFIQRLQIKEAFRSTWNASFMPIKTVPNYFAAFISSIALEM